MNNFIQIYDEVKPATLVAVTKFQSLEVTNKVVEAGVYDIAENRVQKLLNKIDHLDSRARIHFIGPLQTNKVKDIVGKVHCIQSVDRLKLIQKVEQEAKKVEVVQKVLIQVNVAQEPQKQGFLVEELEEAFTCIHTCTHVIVDGLMMMAPFIKEEDELRNYFRKTKELFDYYKKNDYNNVYMNTLSMGMSNDYRIALACGSNMVRLGSKIFDGGNDE